jgi:hypothetical protein
MMNVGGASIVSQFKLPMKCVMIANIIIDPRVFEKEQLIVELDLER